MGTDPRRVRLRALALIAALLVAACTSEPARRDLPDVELDEPAETGGGAGAQPESPAPTTPTDLAGLSGRLAVLDADGNLVTLNPDGSGKVVLAQAEPGRSQVRQATWSPDGRRLAWVYLQVTETGGIATAVATATGEGARPTESRTAIVPFYLSWDPTSTRIAYLGSLSEMNVALGILEVGGRSSGTPLDTGQPFYLSWAPGGEELIVHVGERRLDRLGLDGSLTTVSDRPGMFRAPVWTADGRTFVYAAREPGGQRLVVHDVEAGTGRALVPFAADALLTFVVSPDGRRIAFQVIEEDGSLPLQVIDVRSGETVEVTDAPTAGFFWSPDGERLLFLDPDPGEGELWYRWGVWNGETSFTTPRFLPSLLIVGEYLSFFEQYAQSMSLWSPDGSAFAYPGTSEEGETGIWIQSARPGRAPVLVADGEFVAWSPARHEPG